MLRILLKILLGLALLLSAWLFVLGGLFWFGLRDAGYNPPITMGVENVLASYPCQANPDAWRWDRTPVRLKNIEVDPTRTLQPPQDDIWKYVPVKGTDDKLWVVYWRSDVPPAGPFTLIGYQLHTPPTSTPVPPSLVARSEQGRLYVVEYDNRNYYEFQHQEGMSYFILGALVLVLTVIVTGIVYAMRRWMRSRAAVVARLAGEPTSPEEIAEAQARRARLLATLRDCGVDRAPTSAGLRWVGSVMVVFGLAIIAIIGNTIVDQAATGPDGPFIRIIWLVFGIFVLARVRNWFLRTAWKSVARSAEKELERASSRRPILYLRSFQLDEQIGRPSWFERLLGTIPLQTAEQKVTKLLRKYGPVIAIGRPSERLPPLGAARFYVSHDLWKEKVAGIAREARFVVWATGVTEGLIWEIAHLIEHVPPENVILWAHPHLLRLGPAAREIEWARFRSVLGHLFPKPLPETLGEARFFYFTKDWAPRAVAPPRRPWTWFGTDVPALRALLGVKQGTLSEAKAIYPGWQPEDDFAGLIGASAQPIRWPRPVAFLAVNVVSQLPFSFLNPTWFFVRGVPQIVLTSAAVVAAFRYLPGTFAPAAAAVVPALFVSLWAPLSATLSTFVSSLAFLAGLNWATRRIRPLALALWIGAMCGFLVSELIGYYIYGNTRRYETEFFWMKLLEPVLFAGCLTAAIRFLPAKWRN